MKVYLVGGAVRDKLLGLPIKERDWVVVGATPQEMLEQGFKKVGRDFPVFLHPKTHEEYALARTERKTGKGYTGFVCYSDPTVTLADDLQRRDLTINAIAQDADGKIIDPYGGCKDLKNHLLRHVSAAFTEDPVRILRVARFAARLGDFKVAANTNSLMQTMLASGEVDFLVPERVWQELDRALQESYPTRFFTVLKNCRALAKLFSEISDHLIPIKKALRSVVSLSQDSKVRFAAIAFNLDQIELKKLSNQYRLPNAYRELALLTIRIKNERDDRLAEAEGLVSLIEHADGYRKPERLKQALLACQANDRKFVPVTTRVSRAYEITKKVGLTPKTIEREEKQQLRQILHDHRTKKLEQYLTKDI